MWTSIERFAQKYEPEPMSGCWLWTGAKTRGYGYFGTGGRVYRACRWAYQEYRGGIPVGLVLDHTCRNTACVNPAHLEPVTQRTNVLRGQAPAAQQARRTRCIWGHSFDEQNTYLNPGGRRQCKACRRQTDRRRYQRKVRDGQTS